MSRRKFLEQSGLLAGGMLLTNPLLANVYQPKKKLGVGIIGLGDRGRGIKSVMDTLPECYDVVGVCDVLDFRLAGAKNINAKTYKVKDYRKILEDKKIDVVVIATPLSEHYQIAKDALSAGKHVYLEKTMTYSSEQALDLVKIAKGLPNQVLQVGHQYRSSPLYYKVKEMIEKGYLGKVTHIDCRWDRNWNWRRAVPDPSLERKVNWRMYKEYSGGLAAELLSHQIDFINWTFNTNPQEIFATGGVDYYKDGRETFDNLQAVLRYKDAEMIGTFGATCANKKDGYLFKIKGSKGAISLLVNEGVFYPEKETMEALQTVDGVTGATKITWNKDGGIPILEEPTKDGTWYALKDFYTNVVERKMPDSNVVTGAKVAFCVEMINQSSYTDTLKYWKPEFNI
ncbi:Gfo/Idh/MocA family protein [Pseudopedobacter beijingensis]|uniref:Gfo/Idh/MocA family protein n=1 Tax=Pseudopedobacter beijingensis TaxID=1207056 RepID=A0ABW4I7Z3_9SPHI